ncbi:hypothetical protein ON010_g6186 [Phytophthora cinnamomi]|nr:hypothetical protein ON010_g6186 [Phytophthora cinnamomi]
MVANLGAMVAELKRLAPRLRDYEPGDESWQQAEKKALEARDQVEALLRSAEGVAQLRGSGALQDMKSLVPDVSVAAGGCRGEEGSRGTDLVLTAALHQVTREEIAELKVSDFVLGMIFEKPFAVFERVYRGFGAEYAKELSSEARKSSNLIKSSYVYGEIMFFPFADIIRWVAPSLPEFPIFYDLGSGTGKAVIAASLVHPFDQAIGIELLEPLVHCAEKRKVALEKLKTPLLKTDIDFVTGSLLTTKWEDGDVVFCHGTCFNDKEWAQISLAAEKLKQGAFFISTTHILRTGLFEVVKSVNFTMSWGTATVYIHRRRKIGRWAAQMLRGGHSTRTDLLQQQSLDRQKEEGQATPARDDNKDDIELRHHRAARVEAHVSPAMEGLYLVGLLRRVLEPAGAATAAQSALLHHSNGDCEATYTPLKMRVIEATSSSVRAIFSTFCASSATDACSSISCAASAAYASVFSWSMAAAVSQINPYLHQFNPYLLSVPYIRAHAPHGPRRPRHDGAGAGPAHAHDPVQDAQPRHRDGDQRLPEHGQGGQRVPRAAARRPRGRHQGVQDVHPGVQGPREVRLGRVPLPPRLLQEQPAQDGQALGREGDAQPAAPDRDAGIFCPAPILLRSHVLLMDFIGRDGWAAPRLKDAKISDSRYRECYLYCVKMMRTMYQKCRLVHGDLSEYNILYYKTKLYFIDVSQSVEHEHPSANDFLRKDCRNIADYFRKTGALNPMTTQELFDFVTDPRIADEDVDDHLEAIQRVIAERPVERTNEEQVDEAVFMSTFIPRSLGEVLHSEREQLAYQEGTMEKSLVTAISRLEVEQGSVPAPAMQGTRIMDLLNEDDDGDSDDDEEDEDEEDDGSSDDESDSEYDDDEDDEEDSPSGTVKLTDEQRATFRREKREEREKFKALEKQNKKARKQETKDEKKAKRATKIPKHVKKRHKKLAHQKKKK